MTDVFFSYSNKDRDRVRPIYEALAALDFQVFWDQEVPAGSDWDTRIRDQLTKSRTAVVFWSLESVGSDNVRHEATVAKQNGKLVPVMLDELRVDQFPMGLFNTQAARLMNWTGNPDDPEWQKLIGEIQAKAMPGWVGRMIAFKDEELHTERKKREAAQAGGDAARDQLEKEISSYDDLRQARDAATSDAERARAELDGVKTAVNESKTKNDDLTARLHAAETAAAKQGDSAKRRLPAWAMTAGSLASLIAGAAGVYIFQAVPAQKLAADAIAKVELARTEHAATIETLRAEKKEAEERAERFRAEADKARTERNAAEEQVAEVRARLDAEARPAVSSERYLRTDHNSGASSGIDPLFRFTLGQQQLIEEYCKTFSYNRHACSLKSPPCTWGLSPADAIRDSKNVSIDPPGPKTKTCFIDTRYINASDARENLENARNSSQCMVLDYYKCLAQAKTCLWASAGDGSGMCFEK